MIATGIRELTAFATLISSPPPAEWVGEAWGDALAQEGPAIPRPPRLAASLESAAAIKVDHTEVPERAWRDAIKWSARSCSGLFGNFLSVRRPPTLTDPTLATATAHPTRVHILSILNGRVDTPANIAAELEESIRHVAYHMDVLLGLRCVELVSVKTARGGRVSERFYTAIQRPLFDAASWDRLDPSQKHGVVTTIMRLVSEEVAEAMADGTFFDPDDNHLSRTPMVLDAEGWQEVITILDGALEDLLAVQERTSERLKDGDRETILAKVAMIHFRSPRRW